MSKLSPTLKALINAGFARPNPAPAPKHIGKIYDAIAEAGHDRVSTKPWLAVCAAATFTLNSPDALLTLHSRATSKADDALAGASAAEFIREVGLKCISFNGIPRTINCLNAFRAGLPEDVASRLTTTPTRSLGDPQTLAATQARGLRLWASVYRPFDAKLRDKLALAHPDLPVHILGSHYGPLLSDPEGRGGCGGGDKSRLASLGRVLTSVVAVACLRAQTGVGPQVLSHVFGLRKSVEDGSYATEEDGEVVKCAEWLATDEGSEWILKSVDSIAEALGGHNFAPSSKL